MAGDAGTEPFWRGLAKDSRPLGAWQQGTVLVPASDGLSLNVEAKSPVNFLALEEVFVMTDDIPWDESIFYDEADTTMMRDILRSKP